MELDDFIDDDAARARLDRNKKKGGKKDDEDAELLKCMKVGRHASMTHKCTQIDASTPELLGDMQVSSILLVAPDAPSGFRLELVLGRKIHKEGTCACVAVTARCACMVRMLKYQCKRGRHCGHLDGGIGRW